MITPSLDNLIHKIGGVTKLAAEMDSHGAKITHSAILNWYKSEKILPKKEAHIKAIEAIAEKHNIKISLGI